MNKKHGATVRFWGVFCDFDCTYFTGWECKKYSTKIKAEKLKPRRCKKCLDKEKNEA